MIRNVFAAAAIAAFAGITVAADPCPKCGTGVASNAQPQPKCDNKIYPLSEWHYIRRYCGPVVSPNATYGYFPTQWRQWDGNQATSAQNCATPGASNGATIPSVETKQPEIKPEVKPEVKPEIKPVTPDAPKPLVPNPINPPMIPPSKETAPKPIEKGKSSISIPSINQ